MDELEDSQYSSSRSSATTSNTTARQSRPGPRTEKARLLKPIDRLQRKTVSTAQTSQPTRPLAEPFTINLPKRGVPARFCNPANSHSSLFPPLAELDTATENSMPKKL